MSLELKVKKQIIRFYKKQPGKVDHQKLGHAIDWRLAIIRQLSTQVKRSKLDAVQFSSLSAGLCLIQRQIEDELDLYQQDLQELSGQLENGDIEQDEYDEKLELLTAAIFFLAYLSGSDNDGGDLAQSSLDVLETMASDPVSNAVITDQAIIENYITDEDARNEIDSELAIASQSDLSAALVDGAYEDRQDSLFNRIGLWVTTALGIYGLGQLYNAANPFYEWVYGATDHCEDCARLNGQVHRSLDWRLSGWRPQSRSLACKGYNCACGLFPSSGPASGSF